MENPCSAKSYGERSSNYVEDNHNRQLAVEIVLGTALMAIARKVIVLDFNEVGAEHVYATAAVTLALSVGYYLIVIRRKGSNS